jgi:hypothetical protein
MKIQLAFAKISWNEVFLWFSYLQEAGPGRFRARRGLASDGKDENRVTSQQVSGIIAGGKNPKMEIRIIDGGQEAKTQILVKKGEES